MLLSVKYMLGEASIQGVFSTNTLSSKRLDATGHYVILAKAPDGIWPVGHACAVLCWGTVAAVGASAQHCTGITNWPNTIQCLGSDDIMSPGIKSFATEGVHDKVHEKVHGKVHGKVHDKVHDKAGRDWLFRRMAIRMVYFQALVIL